MAEGFLRHLAGNRVEVDSAGTNPAGLNPYALWAMNEVGIDISHQTSDALSSKNLEGFDHVITVCGDAREACPVLPAHVKSEHWPIPDPARVRGTPEEVITTFRVVRYQIERRVKDLLRRVLNGR